MLQEHTERDVVLLQRAFLRRLGVGEADRGERRAGRRVRLVIDAGDRGANRDRERRLDVGALEVVQHDRLRAGGRRGEKRSFVRIAGQRTLRSPWASAPPSSVTNFFCWKMDLSASGVGDQVPFAFWRQRSFRLARIDTTTLRVSGFSGADVANELPSPSAPASGWTSAMAVPRSAAAVLSGAARTDIGKQEVGVALSVIQNTVIFSPELKGWLGQREDL